MWSYVALHTSLSLTCASLVMVLPLTKTQNTKTQSFYHMLSNKEVYNGSLKIWHHYIRAFFHRKVYVYEIHSTFNMKNLLHKAWTIGGIFTKYSKQKLNTTLRQTIAKEHLDRYFWKQFQESCQKHYYNVIFLCASTFGNLTYILNFHWF